MDIDATLATIREFLTHANKVRDEPYTDDSSDPAEDFVRLAEHVEALDQWMARGGFPQAALSPTEPGIDSPGDPRTEVTPANNQAEVYAVPVLLHVRAPTAEAAVALLACRIGGGSAATLALTDGTAVPLVWVSPPDDTESTFHAYDVPAS